MIIAASIAAALYVMLYTFTAFVPTLGLWGVDHLRYFEFPVRLVLLTIAVIGALPVVAGWYLRLLERGMATLFRKREVTVALALVLGAAAAWGCYTFRIASDMYGDSRTLLQALTIQQYTFADLFDLREFEALTRWIHQAAAQFWSIDPKTAYERISAACGGIYVALAVIFLARVEATPRWKVLSGIILATAGANALFFGHVENYTLFHLCSVVFLMAGWFLFRGTNTLALMVLLFVVGIRLHLVMVVFAPALLYAVLYAMENRNDLVRNLLRPRSILAGVAVSLVLAGAAYLFLFDAATLSLTNPQERLDKIFLPVVNPLPPPHAYSLLSWNHAVDIANVLAYTVSPAALLLLVVGLVFRRSMPWHTPGMIFFLLAGFYALCFVVTVNPILSMPRDWDLFSVAAAPLAFLAMSIAIHLDSRGFRDARFRSLAGSCLAPSILAMAIVAVNANPHTVSPRLVNIGEWVYKSYYIGSSYIINVGQKSIPGFGPQSRERQALIDRLRPGKSSRDLELAFLYRKLGETYFFDKQYRNSVAAFQASMAENPSQVDVHKYLAFSQFIDGQFAAAGKSIGEYNALINTPVVQDSSAIELVGFINYYEGLRRATGDSALIRTYLDQLANSFSPPR